MAKPATVKIKLVSTADTGFYLRHQEESAQHDREDVVPQI